MQIRLLFDKFSKPPFSQTSTFRSADFKLQKETYVFINWALSFIRLFSFAMPYDFKRC